MVWFFTGGAVAAECDFGMGDCEAWGNFEKLGKGPALCQGYVGDGAARLANEVTVFGKVRAVAGGLALDIDLLGKTAFHKGL